MAATRWANLKRWLYRRPMGVARPVAPIPRPPELDRFEGMWVAVLDGQVVVAEPTSHRLALKLDGMDHRKRQRLAIEYVRPASDGYIVGVG